MGATVRGKPRRLMARRVAGGFTLLESLMAASVLSITVLGIISAVSASQRASFEGQKAILAALAADHLITEVVTLPYEQLPALNGRVESPGGMRTLMDAPYPGAYWPVGRTVTVTDRTITDPDTGLSVDGREVVVETDDGEIVLSRMSLFVPEPAS